MLNLARRPRLLMHPAVVFPCALALAGCKPVEEAPAEVSDVLTGFWTQWDVGTDEALGALAVDMAAVLDEDADVPDGDVLVDGFQDRLDADAQAAADLFAPPDDDGSWKKPDPAKARPMFLAKRFTCDLDRLQEILVALNQDELYEGEYEAYDRAYTSDIDTFTAGTTDRVTWEVELTKKVFPYPEYTETLLGGVRRAPLPDTSELESPPAWGGSEFLLARTWIPFPAQADSDAFHFDQDYQIEAYVPWEGGDIIHLYGVWRQLENDTLTMESDTVARIMLNALADWDDTTEAHCAE